MSKKVALYLRISKEDLDKYLDASKSIKNQELMLKEEVKKHKDWQIVKTYCDEDLSGAGIYRPAFQKMISDCENQKIDIVLCKSQSRFSRDMEVIEKYLHNKFILWNVRFISLVDNADTNNIGNKKSRQINALVNEWYLEDLSNNIKSTLRSKWKNGQCTSAFAKYGFIKDAKCKNHLIVDKVASQVIKDIGQMFLKGYGQEKIANVLEKKGIPSPYEYKLLNGSKLKLPIKKNIDNKKITAKGTYIIKILLDSNQILKNVQFFLTIDLKKEGILKIRNITDDVNIYYKNKKILINEDIYSNFYNLLFKVDKLDKLLKIEIEVTIKSYQKEIVPIIKLEPKNKDAIKITYQIRKKFKWSSRTIHKILNDETYHGILSQGKTKTISYKNHKTIATKKDEWILTNSLEKIFDDTTWKQIQTKLKRKEKSSIDGNKHLFSSLVFCEQCNCLFYKNVTKEKNGQKNEYLLCQNQKTKIKNCPNKYSIRVDDLKKCILKELNKFLNEYFDELLLKKYYDKNIIQQIFLDKINTLKKEQEIIIKNIDKQKEKFKQLYIDKINHIIDEEDFVFLKDEDKKSIEKQNKRLDQIKKELTKLENKKNKIINQAITFYPYQNLKTIKKEWLNEFIEKIKIGKLDKINKQRNIIIVWKF